MFRTHSVGFFTVAFRSLIAALVVLGIVYPLVVTGVSQVIMRHHANGSLIKDDQGATRGSELLAQSFHDSQGQVLAQYFEPRPSAAGDGYDALASGGSNLGPNSSELLTAIENRAAVFARTNDVPVSEVPADAVTASASGLDPHVSWDSVLVQVDRVAKARNLTSEQILDIAAQEKIQGLPWGVSHMPVNVVRVNARLDALQASTD
ncbi:potassium-transporting ATPase subunit C [Timonella sp. A28]|uniref:potassium-transporting ATPase subunit C n=1 Tax=Timonella sp. A28 TaxID=3442640 RepID=UPI003EC0A666